MKGKWLTVIICILLLTFGIAAGALVQKRAKIPDLIEQMGAAHYGDAQDAMRELTAMRRLVVGQVCEVLDPKDPTQTDARRWRAAIVLGEIGNGAAVPVLRKALQEFDSKDVRWNCIVALGKLRATEAISDLAAICTDAKTDEVVRVTAIRTLGLLEAKDAVPQLVSLVKTRPDAKQMIAYRREEERKAKERKPLEEAKLTIPPDLEAAEAPEDDTDASHPQLRIACCEALALIGDRSEDVLDALTEAADGDHEPEYAVRAAASVALADLAGPRSSAAADALIGNLRDEQWDMNADGIDDDPDGDLRVTAAYGLGKLGSTDDKVLTALRHAANDKHYWVRQAAVESIKKLGGRLESD